eukprot:231459-Rhodomonas_salina.1
MVTSPLPLDPHGPLADPYTPDPHVPPTVSPRAPSSRTLRSLTLFSLCSVSASVARTCPSPSHTTAHSRAWNRSHEEHGHGGTG